MFFLYLVMDFAELMRLGYGPTFLNLCWKQAASDPGTWEIGEAAIQRLKTIIRMTRPVDISTDASCRLPRSQGQQRAPPDGNSTLMLQDLLADQQEISWPNWSRGHRKSRHSWGHQPPNCRPERYQERLDRLRSIARGLPLTPTQQAYTTPGDYGLACGRCGSMSHWQISCPHKTNAAAQQRRQPSAYQSQAAKMGLQPEAHAIGNFLG